MIVVHMDLNSAITGQQSQLCKILIINDGNGTKNRGNYSYSIWGKNNRLMKQGHIKNWPRLAKHSILLLQAVLEDAYPQTKEKK